MKFTELYKLREDGVKLFITIDAKVDENNNPIRDEKGSLIHTGYYIKQNETNRLYDVAIDVENAPYTYSETAIQIQTQNKEELLKLFEQYNVIYK